MTVRSLTALLTVTTGLVNVRNTGESVVGKEERGEQKERKMFKRRTKATETQLRLSSGGPLGGGMIED